MSTLVINPLPSFVDLSGAPLQGGSLYIGTQNANPQTNPVTVYQDQACTIALAQPIRIQNGVPTLNGAPLILYLQTPVYSVLVNDSVGRAISSLPSVSAALPNVAQAALRTDYPSAGQVQDNTFNVLTTIAGTGDVITANAPLGLSALATDSEYTYTPVTTNATTTPTLSINGITAYTIVDSTGAALPPGALQVGVPYRLLFDGFKLRVISGALAYTTPAQQFTISYSGVGGVGTLTYTPVGPITFRNATAANGAPVTRPAPATPPSITLPSGATLGLTAGVNGNVVVALADNGGSPVLCVAGASPSLDISESGLISPATISAGSTSAGVWYSASAVSANSPYRVLGYGTVNQASAGVWPNSAVELQGMGALAFLALSQPYLRYHQIGEIFDFAGPTPPPGSLQLPAIPTNISRTTYAALFAVIGTQWGAGDGSTTFGCPYVPIDYATVHNPSGLGTVTVGQVISHLHNLPIYDALAYAAGGNAAMGPGNSTNTSSTGGSSNFAAGSRMMKCLQVS